MSKLSHVQKACILLSLLQSAHPQPSVAPVCVQFYRLGFRASASDPLPSVSQLMEIWGCTLLVSSCTCGCYFITYLCIIVSDGADESVISSTRDRRRRNKVEVWKGGGWCCCLVLKECTAGLGNIFKHLMWKIKSFEGGLDRAPHPTSMGVYIFCQFWNRFTYERKVLKSAQWARIATNPSPNMLGAFAKGHLNRI